MQESAARGWPLVVIARSRHIGSKQDGHARFNYITDVWVKWIGDTLYFGATYACPGPAAISPSFEARFARLEHVGGGRFTLSYMRHNDKWFRLPGNWTADESLESIENDEHFQLG